MAIGSSLFLLAAGLILALAVQIDPTPVAGLVIEWDVVGWVLTAVGVIGLLWSLYALNRASTVERRDRVTVRDHFE